MLAEIPKEVAAETSRLPCARLMTRITESMKESPQAISA